MDNCIKGGRSMERTLEERLVEYPELRGRFESILGIVENTGGNIIKADDAEERVLAEIQKIGHQALTSWAQTGERIVEQQMKNTEDIVGNGKKNPAILFATRNDKNRGSDL